MNPIDKMGNVLKEKDAVCLHINAMVTGIVEKIKEASVIMGKEHQPMPGYITFNVPITVPFHPNMPRLQDCIKIVIPPSGKS